MITEHLPKQSARESTLALARRHVILGEVLVARQMAIVEQLRRQGHDSAPAERLLATLRQSLNAMREHLQLEATASLNHR